MPGGSFEILPRNAVKTIISHLSLEDVINLASISRTGYSLFQPIANELRALAYVAHGSEALLINLINRTIKKHPELLFKKRPIVDPSGRFIPSISPYQLIFFLCDEVMKDKIIPLIPKEMESIRQQQYKELGSGGADLIKLDKNPESIPIKDILELRKFKTTFNLGEEQITATFSLLENPDGIIFYQDEQDKVHFYYVNPNTKALKYLKPEALTQEEQQALDTFITSFTTMEPNTGRRSSDAEHQLIQKIMNIKLHREGIRYKRDGEWFRDRWTEFRVLGKYITSARLYAEALETRNFEKLDQFLCEEGGKAQGEVMWVLQRFCEERPFYPLPHNFNGFKRGYAFYNWKKNGEVTVFSNGELDEGLGKEFCLYKDGNRVARARLPQEHSSCLIELIAIGRLVESAKANAVEEFEPNQDLEQRGANPL